jgi:L-threonylcarbamoyladenylate synthase
MNQEITEDIKKSCEIMMQGGIILYPTDTIWGIGCDATNPEAVKRVYDIKQRSDSKAMLVLVDSFVKVNFYVTDLPDVAYDLVDLSTKPLTIIYPGARNLAENLIAQDGTVGIRVTKEVSRKDCASAFAKPLYRRARTSADSRRLPLSRTLTKPSNRKWTISSNIVRKNKSKPNLQASSSWEAKGRLS